MSVVQAVIALKEKHQETWRDLSEWRWLLGLLEEVGELALSLIGLHKGPVDWELTQIAAIAMNWLEMRQVKFKRGGEDVDSAVLDR